MLCFFVYQLLYVIHGCSVNESLILKSKFSGKFFKVYTVFLKRSEVWARAYTVVVKIIINSMMQSQREQSHTHT